VRKPNGPLYFALVVLLTPVLKICFRVKVDRKAYAPPKKGSFVVLCNHESFMDFVLSMWSVYPRRLNAVAALKFYYYPALRRILNPMGAISKSLFDPDPKAIMGILSVIKRGGALLLFPEGRCSTDGAYAGMHKATGKLLKKLRVPVVSCRVEGAYVCMPFWRKGIRFGREYVTLANLFTAEDTQRLSVDEINSRIDARLSGADSAAAPKRLGTARARDLTQGLENILYHCPRCGKEFTLRTERNMIICDSCGGAAEMRRDATLSPLRESAFPSSVRQWFALQAARETERIRENPGAEYVRIDTVVRMRPPGGDGLAECGRGELWLNREGWHYAGTLRGEYTRMDFALETVPAMPFDPCDNFQIYSQGLLYAFTPAENRRACVKYSLIGEAAYRCFSAAPQTTPAACFRAQTDG
jgi:1-acyl-sn-glycerol-3-phosphate acyltransferase/predicted RNA-binding Zn-ribbon protein involved in translation (DUF1610 family)